VRARALIVVAIVALGVTAVGTVVLPSRLFDGGRRIATRAYVAASPTSPMNVSITPGQPTPTRTGVGGGSVSTLPGAVVIPSAAPARSRSTAQAVPVARVTQVARDLGATSDAGTAQHASKPLFDPYVPGATIAIPRLQVRAPVYERGIDATRHLPIAPGYAATHFWYSGALGRPGNYVVYGHDDIEGNIFQNLPAMRAGDRVYLDSGAHRYAYQVSGSRIVSPLDVSVMAPTRSATLTLISCYPFDVDTQRIVVTATLLPES